MSPLQQTGFNIVLHGGSGANPDYDYRREIAHMRGLIEAGRDRLRRGDQALDVASDTVAALESSGLYIAGRGASPNLEGEYELDACLMEGTTGRAAGVAALVGIKSPISTARAVMDRTPHVLLAGSGATQFARRQSLAAVEDPDGWYTRACAFEATPPATHGTVGCVVRDAAGHLAAATSTGGVFDKLPGRVGDSAIIGAGTWADDLVAVSCTGHGEFFIRAAAAAQIAHRMRFGKQALETAASDVIAEISRKGGMGGLIALDSKGNVAIPFASTGMKRAALLSDGTILASAP
jgi:isoaspartyl peptidase/L-asparaginase-like protein (Ntn-hydrolase superfamily)